MADQPPDPPEGPELLHLAWKFMDRYGTGHKYAGMGLWIYNEAKRGRLRVSHTEDGFGIWLDEQQAFVTVNQGQVSGTDHRGWGSTQVVRDTLAELHRELVLDELADLGGRTPHEHTPVDRLPRLLPHDSDPQHAPDHGREGGELRRPE